MFVRPSIGYMLEATGIQTLIHELEKLRGVARFDQI